MIEKKKSVIIELIGGLGNQLFGYSAASYLAQRNGSNLILDTSFIGMQGTNHNCTILDFELPNNFVVTHNKISRIHLSVRRIRGGIRRKFPLIGERISRISKYYNSPVLGYDPNLVLVLSGTRISGYFQTWKYVTELIRDLGFALELKNPSPWYTKARIEIEETRPTVLHIRRGDYVSEESFGLLSPKYYSSALEKLNNGKIGGIVWVFSDDLVQAEKMLSGISDYRFYYVDPPEFSGASESLALMSAADKIIIANSTYSWWAAMLSQEGSRVVAPLKWFKSRTDPEDLIPPNWEIVESDWI